MERRAYCGRAWLALACWLWLGCQAAGAGQSLTPPMRAAVAARLQGALALDGRLDEPAWQAAPLHTGFGPVLTSPPAPLPPEVQTSFRVLYDEAHLYFGILCREPHPDQLVVQAAPQHDAAMWSDDDVELFLDPVGDRREYYQLAVNSQGTQADLYWREGGAAAVPEWSSEWQAAVAKGPDYWSLEVAVPLALLANRPASPWADRWVFSLARTRAVPPGYNSQYSPAFSYHDVTHFGYLDGVKVDRSRFQLGASSPAFMLAPLPAAQGPGYDLATALVLENGGARPFRGRLEMEILGEGGRGASVALTLPARAKQRVVVGGGLVPTLARRAVILRARHDDGTLCLVTRLDPWLTCTPLAVKLTSPNYRNTIYATQGVDEIRGYLVLGLPLEGGTLARVTLSAGDLVLQATETAVEGKQVPFVLPAAGLAEGTYTIAAQIMRPGANGSQPQVLAQVQTTLRKLPPAPAVEARLDDQGNLLVDGHPVFIRGWYGSLSYLVSAASLADSRLPHATNYVMYVPPEEQASLNLYCLQAVEALIDETKAKLDEPLDEALREKLRAAVASVRDNRRVIGYYLSDEPECRGLSPVFLHSVYEFLAQEDPYRFVKIISRSPLDYLGACDVICPHPYMNPQLRDGRRFFASPLSSLRRAVAEACSGNDGSKAVWCMPQAFSYPGRYDRPPELRELRWFVHTALANGAKGIVPFLFTGYWNHRPTRIALDAIFDELAFLAPAWLARDAAAPARSYNRAVDVIAKCYRPVPGVALQTFIVAAHQGSGPTQATISVPALAANGNTRLLVIGENRCLPVTAGRFSDRFDGLGTHVYTTLEVVPDFPSVAELGRQIALLGRQAQDGNLLADSRVQWTLVNGGWNFVPDGSLADGEHGTTGWLPAYGDKTQCEITFAQPVTFSRLVLYTPSIKDALAETWQGGRWRPLCQWRDQYLYRLEYQGPPVTTTRLRIRPTAARQGPTGPGGYEITELAIYR